MGIGAGIVLVAIGAILKFAVHYTVAGVDIGVVGIILMIAGVAGVLLDAVIFMPRRRGGSVTTSTTQVGSAAVVQPTTVRRTTTTTDDVY